MYTCTSQNTLSMTTVNKSQELLVYCDHDNNADSTEHTDQTHPDQTEAEHQSADC
ncbi:hypothetical protein DPX16_21576 [Anabarilius grahami]|uniref:Uncharacterized protein n=1 Tax=Anabarilius grahami TaxID=495550 RepID=A0A3N0XH99_ANAGA|nr:hypothetical protein DPX16_21576 [Anabarilius grahami]